MILKGRKTYIGLVFQCLEEMWILRTMVLVISNLIVERIDSIGRIRINLILSNYTDAMRNWWNHQLLKFRE